MKCFICDEIFFIERRFHELFSFKKLLICDKCYKKYPLKINVSVIPLNGVNVYFYSLFDKFFYINFNAFAVEYSMVFKSIRNNHKDNLILALDYIIINDFFIKMLSYFSLIEKKDIYIICYYIKN